MLATTKCNRLRNNIFGEKVVGADAGGGSKTLPYTYTCAYAVILV